MEFFPFGNGNAHFGEVAFVEVDHERYDGQSVLVYLVVEFEKLLFVQQQLSRCTAVTCKVTVGGLQFCDMGIHQIEFTLDKTAESIIEVGTFGTQRLDLASLKHNTRFELFEYLIIMSGFFVLCNDIDAHASPLR